MGLKLLVTSSVSAAQITSDETLRLGTLITSHQAMAEAPLSFPAVDFPNRPFAITPPLLNSSNPWATTQQDLQALYDCPYTGAVTTRTSLWSGFNQDPKTHQYIFFSTVKGHAESGVDVSGAEGRGEVLEGETSSLNTLGYSPLPFEEYVEMIVKINRDSRRPVEKRKQFIVSVTGTAEEVGKCAKYLLNITSKNEGLKVMMEINLSCPNILDKPPPAYDGAQLAKYIRAISEAKSSVHRNSLHVGIKTPPYTYHGQFKMLIDVLERSTELPGGCPISFITATNTLGSCLVLNQSNEATLKSASGAGIGGMAGDSIHPLSLGNVKTLREMLNAHEDIRNIAIIGIGGVSDAAGFKRMKSVGATAIGVGTAFGREGVAIFEKISAGLTEQELK